MADFPLSKTLDPADFAELAEELKIVDLHFTREREQHPMRRWEYALALRAQQYWYERAPALLPQGPVIDVGGAGSPFWRMVNPEVCRIVDPEENETLAEHLRCGAALASEVYCLSVLEHVEDLEQFVYHLSCLVAPGGLLVLTMDACEQYGSFLHADHDCHHFHWMRRRIFCAGEWPSSAVALPLLAQGFDYLGEIDPVWHGPQVFDYSFASLVLTKRP